MTTPVPSSDAASVKPTLTSATWMALAFIVVFAYLDWITHRDAAFTIVFALVAGGCVLYRRTLIDKLNLTEAVSTIPRRVKPVLAAIPGVLYFLARGQGTSGAGGVVFVSMVIVVAVSVGFGPQLDAKLAGFYASRNRVLPRLVRMVLAIVLPVLIAFLVVHGSLADLPALFGGRTNHPSTPRGIETRFFFATLLSAAIAWALLREADLGATGTDPTTAAPATPRPRWTPTHSTPAGGMNVWESPTAATVSTHLDGNLPVQVVERSGDWARVAAANGWSGWVDGRLLVVRGAS